MESLRLEKNRPSLTPSSRRLANAFSLVEVVLVLAIMGVLSLLVMPSFSNITLKRLSSTSISREITSDLRRTRTLALGEANSNSSGYALRMTGGPPYTGYQIVNLNTSATVTAKSIPKDASVTGSSDFSFGPLGNLNTGSGTSLSVSGGGKTYSLTLTSATGSVKLEEL